eukprot:scaffold36_cov137-Skeletonema_dohrnii-CCMP3373.AAC.5
MDPPTALDKNLSSTTSTSTSTSRLWRSSKNAPVTGTVKGERQRLNYRCRCSQNGQNKTFPHCATAASPQQHRRRRGLQQGANGLFRTLIISIIFVLLSLLKLAPLAHNSVEDHKSEIDLPPQLGYHLSKETVIKVLIIATRPSSADRVRAIWSLLECFTEGIDHVLISAPDEAWSRSTINSVVELFKNSMRGNYTFELDAAFYVNDRYDGGLWCDGIEHYFAFNQSSSTTTINNKKQIFLVNDSAFALRKYSSLTEKIANETDKEMMGDDGVVKFVSLNGDLRKDDKGGFHQTSSGGGFHDQFWLESVYRGFTPSGVSVFFNHTCRMNFPCNERVKRMGRNRKRCIVEEFEISLADAFIDSEIGAMFPTYFPRHLLEQNSSSHKRKWNDTTSGGIDDREHWARGGKYFKYLVEEHAFPIRKVHNNKELRGECTKGLIDEMAFEGLSFS